MLSVGETHSSTKQHPLSPLHSMIPNTGHPQGGRWVEVSEQGFCILYVLAAWGLLPMENCSEFTSPSEHLRAHPQEVKKVGSQSATCSRFHSPTHEDLFLVEACDSSNETSNPILLFPKISNLLYVCTFSVWSSAGNEVFVWRRRTFSCWSILE